VTPLHADELPIDLALVRGLVDRSFPEYAGRSLTPLADSGSSNALFRLGSDLLVRLPRQPGGGATIDKEARWLPQVAEWVAEPVPRVVGVGDPALGYPERWSITTWVPGRRPARPSRSAPPAPSAPPASTGAGGARLAADLARFIAELRGMPLPPEAVGSEGLTWYRGLPLAELDEDFRATVGECRGLDIARGLDLDACLRLWDQALAGSAAESRGPSWFHGDLVLENLLIDDGGALCGVLDFGGLAIGDPTVDLIVGWEALDADGRAVVRQALDVDDATWVASRGWALLIALVTLPYYSATMPGRCADRLAMAHAALSGP
jgi:aminoglycoside phosphotransferase (APT) family kinase protein